LDCSTTPTEAVNNSGFSMTYVSGPNFSVNPSVQTGAVIASPGTAQWLPSVPESYVATFSFTNGGTGSFSRKEGGYGGSTTVSCTGVTCSVGSPLVVSFNAPASSSDQYFTTATAYDRPKARHSKGAASRSAPKPQTDTGTPKAR
jgi:hypothetical protein